MLYIVITTKCCERGENVKTIKNLRQRAGLTQEELAVKMQITQQAVARWENENTAPSVDKLPQLARILGCTIDELYGEAAGA